MMLCHDGQSRFESSSGSLNECRLSARWPQRCPQTKPVDLGSESASRLLPPASLLLLIPKAGTHFTVPRRVQG